MKRRLAPGVLWKVQIDAMTIGAQGGAFNITEAEGAERVTIATVELAPFDLQTLRMVTLRQLALCWGIEALLGREVGLVVSANRIAAQSIGVWLDRVRELDESHQKLRKELAEVKRERDTIMSALQACRDRLTEERGATDGTAGSLREAHASAELEVVVRARAWSTARGTHHEAEIAGELAEAVSAERAAYSRLAEAVEVAT